MKWDDLRPEFEWDGSWRDIYVLNAGPRGWASFWRVLNGASLRIKYQVDELDHALPPDVESVFLLRSTRSPLLSVFLTDTMQLNCHFFNDQDIELDLDPREVTNQANLDSLLEFMRGLGRATSADVVLTPENTPTVPIVRYDAVADTFVHLPPASST